MSLRTRDLWTDSAVGLDIQDNIIRLRTCFSHVRPPVQVPYKRKKYQTKLTLCIETRIETTGKEAYMYEGVYEFKSCARLCLIRTFKSGFTC